jgi:hypothetical protein
MNVYAKYLRLFHGQDYFWFYSDLDFKVSDPYPTTQIFIYKYNIGSKLSRYFANFVQLLHPWTENLSVVLADVDRTSVIPVPVSAPATALLISCAENKAFQKICQKKIRKL